MTGKERQAAPSEREIPEDFLQKELERIEKEVDKANLGGAGVIWWNLWNPEEWVSQYSHDELVAIILQADYVPPRSRPVMNMLILSASSEKSQEKC